MEDIILLLLVIIIPTIASVYLNSTYSKYNAIKNKKGLTGFDVARKILDENGLKDMYIVETPGNLTDHYDPRKKVVRLSTNVFHGESIGALAVAAHECGHAIQDKGVYKWLRVRSIIFPVASFSNNIAYILFFISILLQVYQLFLVAIAMYLIALAFQIVTLPVEFDASKRALKCLTTYNLIADDERVGSEKVLKAAALTYVAAVLSSIINIIRLFNIYERNR